VLFDVREEDEFTGIIAFAIGGEFVVDVVDVYFVF
jgi:hypothetical protein